MHRPQLHRFGIKDGATPVVRGFIALALDLLEQLQDGGGPILGAHSCTVAPFDAESKRSLDLLRYPRFPEGRRTEVRSWKAARGAFVSDTSIPGQRTFPLPHILKPGEVVEGQAEANGAVIVVTEDRLVVVDDDESVLDIPFTELRRVQFDIERGRDATLVIVPEHISNWPRVISVPLRNLRETSLVLARIGERINEPAAEHAG